MKVRTVALFAIGLVVFVLSTHTILEPNPDFMAGHTGVDQAESESPDHYLTQTFHVSSGNTKTQEAITSSSVTSLSAT